MPKSGAYCKSELGHLSKGWVGIRSNNEIEGWKLPWIPVVEAQCGHYSVCRDWSGRLWDSNLRSVGLFSHRRNVDHRQNFQPKDGEAHDCERRPEVCMRPGVHKDRISVGCSRSTSKHYCWARRAMGQFAKNFCFQGIRLDRFLSVLGLLGIVIKWLIIRSTLLKSVKIENGWEIPLIFLYNFWHLIWYLYKIRISHQK